MNETAVATGPHPFASLLRRNVGLNLAGQGIPLVVGVASLPFTIRWLGPDRFGLLGLAWGLVGYFSVFDLGLGRATTKFVAQALADDSAGDAPALLGTSLRLQALFGVVGAAILAGAAPWLASDVLNIPARLVGEAQSSFWVIASAVPVFLAATSLRGALEAAQRFGIVNAVRAPLQSAYFLVPLAGAALGWGLPLILAGIVGAQVVAALAMVVACRRTFRGRPFGYDPRLRSRLLGYGAWVMVTSVLAPVLLYADRFVIGTLVSVEAVGYYVAPYEIVIRTLVIPISVVTTLFPAFSALGPRDADGRAQDLLARGTRYILVLLVPVALATVLLAEPMLDLWLGADFARRSSSVLRILSFGVLVNGLAQVPFAFVQGIGRPDVSAKIHAVELPVHLGLAFLLVGAWGIAGAATAWTIRAAVDLALLAVAARVLWRGRQTGGRA